MAFRKRIFCGHLHKFFHNFSLITRFRDKYFCCKFYIFFLQIIEESPRAFQKRIKCYRFVSQYENRGGWVYFNPSPREPRVEPDVRVYRVKDYNLHLNFRMMWIFYLLSSIMIKHVTGKECTFSKDCFAENCLNTTDHLQAMYCVNSNLNFLSFLLFNFLIKKTMILPNDVISH